MTLAPVTGLHKRVRPIHHPQRLDGAVGIGANQLIALPATATIDDAGCLFPLSCLRVIHDFLRLGALNGRSVST